MSRRRIVAVVVAVTCLPAVTVLWLGARLLEQDRRLETQYKQERREQAADRAVRSLQASLSDAALFQSAPGERAILVSYPAGPALFQTEAKRLPEAPARLFHEGEAIEYRGGDLEKTAALYRRLTAATAPSVRAGAWLRLARTLRKARRHAAALAAYDELSRFENVAAAGRPASLAAAWGRCILLEELTKEEDLRHAAQSLRQSLDRGRWPLSRAAYDAIAGDVERWTAEKRPREKEILTEAANSLWLRVRNGEEPGEGRRSVTADAELVTLLWKPVREGTAVFAASRAFVEQVWLHRTGETAWLHDETGHVFPAPKSQDAVLRHPAETGLPWVLAVAAPSAANGFGARRQLLLLLLGVVALFTLVGGYLVLRALLREFALTRMQSDFVSAVSHEFRTPLTSLRLITEALEDERVPDPEQRRAGYRSLARATQRLHRLVEDLLDFRRMESGAAEYHIRSLDAGEVVREVVEEFQQEVEKHGFHVQVQGGDAARINADRSALSRALWNLLDNAVKYSGDSREIHVRLERNGPWVRVAVADRGIGIAPQDRGRLFTKFYRGEEARRTGIRGTGIGLAMVAHIVTAHGGRISVESELGRGSTFTMTLPLEKS